MPNFSPMPPDEILRAVIGLSQGETRSLSSLARLWRALEDHLQCVDGTRSDDLVADRSVIKDNITRAQTQVLQSAERAQCENLLDAAYKLALWRWDAVDSEFLLDELSRSERMLYTAFLDLVRLSNARALLLPTDIVHEQQRNIRPLDV